MANDNRGELQSPENKTGPRAPEQTRPGPVYSPAVDIFEHEGAITVLADMPGVKARDLEIDLRENVLTLTGRVNPPDVTGQAHVLREYEPGTFFRQFTPQLRQVADVRARSQLRHDAVVRRVQLHLAAEQRVQRAPLGIAHCKRGFVKAGFYTCKHVFSLATTMESWNFSLAIHGNCLKIGRSPSRSIC